MMIFQRNYNWRKILRYHSICPKKDENYFYLFHKLRKRSIIIGKIRFSYLLCMNLQKLMERRLKKEKRWIARGIERWISSFGSKNEEQEKEERSGHRSTSFDPIEKDSVRFLRLLSKLGQIYREFRSNKSTKTR